MTGPNADVEFDLVVIGSGAGGLTAALSAAAGGASVLVLEKTDLIGGTTALSGGVVWAPANYHMSEVGVADSIAEGLQYLQACVGEQGDEAVPQFAGRPVIRIEPGCRDDLAEGASDV